jgi:uncharacterized surface protein with fasciclin (FAS1) repeats
MSSQSPLLTCLLAATFPLSFVSQSHADAKAASWRGQSITEFNPDENKEMGWQIVNDGVMGGLSQGNAEFTDEGIMKFSGTLSLENNGGFTTARSESVELNLSNDLGLLLLVKGDGRTYEARLDSDATYRGMPVSFAGKFTTTKGEWQQVKIPFSDFKGSWRGKDLPDEKLNPANITRVWILLGDKNEGPFSLEVDWIRTYGKGQGNFTERTKSPAPAKVTKTSQGPASLIDTAVADGRFGTLKKALDVAGLTPFFQWDNKLTVFAPTDEAFAKLPEETLKSLLQPENKEQLVAVLSHHVVTGQVQLADALEARQAKTIQGAPLSFTFLKGKVLVNDASLIDADIVCSDGVIHVVDTVLLPPKPARETLLSTAKKAGGFSTLLAAVEAAGLTEALEGDGPFTLFAPTDEAFQALPEGTVASLLKKENQSQLIEVLKNHAVAGEVSAGDALNAGTAKSLQGGELKFSIKEGVLKVNDATIRSVGINGRNGIIHVIDSVLLPANKEGKKKDLQSSGSCPSDCEKPGDAAGKFAKK